jgi:hypothetical protein
MIFKKSFILSPMLRKLGKTEDLLINSIQQILLKPQITVSWQFHLLLFFIAFIILVSRRPDALFQPQFWAEDGTIFLR